MVRGAGERGSSLIVAILATAMIGVSVMIVTQDLNDRQRLFRHQAAVVGLVHLGDAAFAETLAELDRDAGFSGMSLREIDNGAVWSRVQPGSPSTVSVTAEAELDGWRGAIEAEVEIGPAGPVVLRWQRSSRPVQGSSRLLRRKSTSLR